MEILTYFHLILLGRGITGEKPSLQFVPIVKNFLNSVLIGLKVSGILTFLFFHLLDLGWGRRLLLDLGSDDLFLASTFRSCSFGFGFRRLLLSG